MHPVGQSANSATTADQSAVPVSATAFVSIANRGTVRRAVFVLAMPVLGEELLNSLVGIFDVWLAGRISVAATAAIGLGAYVEWLITMLFMLVGIGTTALVARFTGAVQRERANHYANQSMALAAGMGFAAFALIYTFAPWMGRLQNMSGETLDIVVRYLRIDGTGHVFTSLTLVGAAALRGVGDMRTPLKILTVVNIVNMLVSYGLVFGAGPLPELGTDGIAIGTVAARFVGGVLTLTVLGVGRSNLRITAAALRPHIESARRILRIGLPAALDGAVMWSGHFIFLIIIANLGGQQIAPIWYAAHIIGVRIEAFTYLPAGAWSKATATVVGQALGAGNRQRAIRAGHEGVFQCGILGIGLTAFYYFGAEAIFHTMQSDAIVWMVGVPALKMAAFFQIFLLASIIYIGALRGAGDTRYPLAITVVSVGLVRLPLGYFLGITLGWGLMGAWGAMCIDMAVRGTLAFTRFTRGKWLTARV
jgi:putative MATE family efflux protein